MGNYGDIINLIRSGKSAKDVVHEIAKDMNNPLINNLVEQLDNGNNEEANKIIGNLMQQNGMSERFNQFKQFLGMK